MSYSGLAVSSTSVNQQYILSEVPLNRNIHKKRWHTDWTLWPEALYFPNASVFTNSALKATLQNVTTMNNKPQQCVPVHVCVYIYGMYTCAVVRVNCISKMATLSIHAQSSPIKRWSLWPRMLWPVAQGRSDIVWRPRADIKKAWQLLRPPC